MCSAEHIAIIGGGIPLYVRCMSAEVLISCSFREMPSVPGSRWMVSEKRTLLRSICNNCQPESRRPPACESHETADEKQYARSSASVQHCSHVRQRHSSSRSSDFSGCCVALVVTSCCH